MYARYGDIESTDLVGEFGEAPPTLLLLADDQGRLDRDRYRRR